MKIHKEGYVTVFVTFIMLFALSAGLIYILPSLMWLKGIIITIALTFFLRIAFFFRNPPRLFQNIEGTILAPADGAIVAIEEVYEAEYLKTNCLQVSVFMSPTNVHINWIPITGLIRYVKHHPGKHMVAWHPKSSTLNERTSIGLQLQNGKDILIRQIAGAMARRIVCYAKEGKNMKQHEELGFIKFGSRVDVFLPLGSTVQVHLKQQVVGGVTVLAKIG